MEKEKEEGTEGNMTQMIQNLPHLKRRLAQTERQHLPFTPEKEMDYLYRGGVPTMFIFAKLSDFPETLQQFKGKGVFISGGVGSGKTHLAVALMREQLSRVMYEVSEGIQPTLIKKTVPIFVTIPDLYFEIKRAYRGGAETEAEIINKYTEVDFLVMDDYGVEKVTEWSGQIQNIIIDRRCRELKKTVITSNLSLDQISHNLDDRIASRIAGMCEVVKLTGKDRRLKR